MLQISFTLEEREKLNYQRYNHPHPFVQKKMEVLYLKSLDRKLPHELIAEIANVSQNTMLSYFRDYQTGGIEKLKEVNFYRPQSELFEHKQTIEQYFRQNPPASLAEASAKIEELTGIKRGLTQTAKFIKNLGMNLRKVGSIPGKAITESKKRNKRNSK
jgi:transposase